MQTLDVLHQLEWLSTEQPETEIIQAGVNIAQAATQSQIAYLHFLNEDQNTIELGVWSHDTLQICTAVYDRHYPVAAAGIWADTARLGQPCIHNDYQQATHRKGLPDGHVPLDRHLGLPVIENGTVRLLIGVGNKPSDYDDEDVKILQLIGQRIWSITRQRRVLERYLDLAQRFRHVQEIAAITGFEYDVDEDQLNFDHLFAPLFNSASETPAPDNLESLLAYTAPGDQAALAQILKNCQPSRQVLRLNARRASGEIFPAELKIEFRPREIGQGLIGIGILRDISEQMHIEDLRQRANTDPLTGLPNRNRLHALFAQGFGRRGKRDAFAFHYIDLDEFKPVNDRFGHPVGDEVLKLVARKIQQSVRRDDLVVRLGGDEFAVVQMGLDNPEDATTLAAKLVSLLSEPMVALGHTVRVGASIGVALCLSGDCELMAVSSRADQALYQAKAAGRNGYRVSLF